MRILNQIMDAGSRAHACGDEDHRSMLVVNMPRGHGSELAYYSMGRFPSSGLRASLPLPQSPHIRWTAVSCTSAEVTAVETQFEPAADS